MTSIWERAAWLFPCFVCSWSLSARTGKQPKTASAERLCVPATRLRMVL